MKIFLLIGLSFLIISCQTDPTTKIEDRDQLIDIIIDLQTIKEVVSLYPHEMKDSVNSVLLERFYEMHQTDSLSLLNQFVDLRKDPELLKELHEEALEKVNRLILPQ